VCCRRDSSLKLQDDPTKTKVDQSENDVDKDLEQKDYQQQRQKINYSS